MAYGTATLTGTYQTWNGEPAQGTVEIIPNSKILVDAEGDVILTGRVKVTLDESGSFSVTLPATDDATVEPATGRQYAISAKLHHQHLPAITGVELATGETADVADLTSGVETAAAVSLWLTQEEYDALAARVADLEAAPGGVSSVNGESGAVSLTAADVGADPAGTAAAGDAALDTRLDAVETAVASVPSEASISATIGSQASRRKRQSFTVDRAWPYPGADFRLVWTEGSGATATYYAFGSDLALYKSTDRGRYWTPKASLQPAKYGYQSMFLKLGDGTLLTVADNGASPPSIVRSTNDGGVWSTVFTFRTDATVLTSQSWCVDDVTGYIYVGEYHTAATFTEIRIIRSTDNGATWSTWTTFPGPASTDTANKITHVHSCQYDTVSQRVHFAVGDDWDSTGVWRVNAAGTGVEKVLTTAQAGRKVGCIGLMFFPDYIAWGTDVQPGPGFIRIARTEIGKASPAHEFIESDNYAIWTSCRAADDGSTWLAFSGCQPGDPDQQVRIYALDQQGARVTPVGEIAAVDEPYSTLVPVGQARRHGSTVHLVSRGFGQHLSQWSIRARVGIGAGVPVVVPPHRTNVQAWMTQSSGLLNVPASGTVRFGNTRSPRMWTQLYIYDMGVAQNTAGGNVKVVVRRLDTNAIIGSTSAATFRTGGTEAAQVAVAILNLPPDTRIDFQLENQIATAADCSGYVTYGWGYLPT